MALLASLVATGVSSWFAVRLLGQWRATRFAPMLWWGASVAMFAVASLMLLGGELVGWNEVTFRTFYLFGAVLNVPWLALGSIEVNRRSVAVTRFTALVALLVGVLFVPAALRGSALALPGALLGLAWGLALLGARASAWRSRLTLAVLVAFSLAAAVAVPMADLVATIPTDGIPEGSDLFGEGVRGLAVGGNALGATVVILGALASALVMAWGNADAQARLEFRGRVRRFPVDALALALFRGWRAAHEAGLAHLAVGNLIIGLGVLVAAGSGGMFSFLGATTGHAIGLGLGVSIMAAGFTRTQRPLARRQDAPGLPATEGASS